MAKTPVKKKKPKSYPKLTAAQERQNRSESAFVAKSASSTAKKPAEKKKGRSILGRMIRGEKVLYDMKKRKLILEPENKKKPVKKAK